MFENIPPPRDLAVMVIAFLMAITIHEFAHARAALAAGDDTAKLAGRVSLNPLDHLDPIGTIFFAMMMLSGFGIGWAKPVPVNTFRLKSPRWDSLKISLWGPLSNLLLALALTILYRLIIVPFAEPYMDLVEACIWINLALAFFNLIPVPPLDGSHILSSLLPIEMARSFDATVGRYGMFILVALIFTGLTRAIVVVPASILFRLLIGI